MVLSKLVVKCYNRHVAFQVISSWERLHDVHKAIFQEYILLRPLFAVLFVCSSLSQRFNTITTLWHLKSTMGDFTEVMNWGRYWFHTRGKNTTQLPKVLVLCFQEKYMNESFDMDECCSELHHSKVSIEKDLWKFM